MVNSHPKNNLSQSFMTSVHICAVVVILLWVALSMYEVIYTNSVKYQLNGAFRWELVVPHGLSILELTHVFNKEVGLRAYNFANICRLNSQHKGGGGPIGPYNELKNLHFDNEEYMHMSSKIHEANGYGHDLELAIIL